VPPSLSTVLLAAWIGGTAVVLAPNQSAGAIPCGVRNGFSRDRLRTLSVGGGEVSRLAAELSGFVGTLVADATGLSGRFDIELSWDAVPRSADAAVETRLSLEMPLKASLA
jgi:uncharacterized protein (TIGR03435 family)